MPPEIVLKQAVTQSLNPKLLDRTVVALPLLRAIADTEEAEKWMTHHPSSAVKDFNSVIFLARNYPEGPPGALKQIKELLERILGELGLSEEGNRLLQVAPKARENRRFVVAHLERRARLALVDRDRKEEFPAIDRLRANHFDVIIDVNLHHPFGRAEARKWLVDTLRGSSSASSRRIRGRVKTTR
jgi:hypothetical protein